MKKTLDPDEIVEVMLVKQVKASEAERLMESGRKKGWWARISAKGIFSKNTGLK